VKVQSDGIWGCGVAAEQCDLNKVPTVEKSWVLTSERTIQKEGKDVESVEEICEGDVIGVTYDHVELQFYLNSNPIGKKRGLEMFPNVSFRKPRNRNPRQNLPDSVRR
jgi:hypothetical protein